jgi:predicted transcriptional regulator
MFGIISDDEFEVQLTELSDGKKTSKIVNIERGRGPVKEVAPEIRKLIATAAIEGGSGKSLSEVFGLSQSSISAYKNGATSTTTYNEPKEELVEHNNQVRERIISSSRKKLELALESITPEKLENAKLKDVSGVARDMSAVIKNMEPQINLNPNLNQQFIFYAPKTRNESDFEVIEARE